jgi:phospholipid/cholesterol/gamma-HCH transport system substrate-binding protein
MDRLRHLAQSKALRFVIAGVVVIAGVFVVIDVTRGDATYPLNAVYASAPGLFPGATVDVLGVPVGTVTSVTNVDDRVDVGMRVHDGTRIPSSAVASLVAPELLGQPDVDLNPGYTSGPHLRPGATISESHTSVPVSTDQLLKELQRTLQALNPHAVGDLITNLSQDLDGQGAGLNKLIEGAAGTIQLLANKGDDLGQLNGTLAQVTGTLDSDTAQIEQLVKQYDTVSSVIAQHSGQLNDAISQLAGATTSLVTLLTPNLQPLEADVGTVTTAGRTLDRNIGNVDEILQQANNLFQGAKRAFDPTYNWLNLNAALPVGVSGDYVAGLVRDRLAGICRRLAANHATGLSAATLADLESCGDPNSDFFDPLINEIPTILGTVSSLTSSSSASALLQKGLDQIGSIGAASGAPSSGSSNIVEEGPSTSSPSVSPVAPSGTAPTTTPGSLCSVLGKLLGCAGGKSTAGGAAPKSSAGTGGVAGLLSKKTNTTKKQPAAVELASNPASGPSLDAPAASLLPPLPSNHHTHKAHRGLLAQWAHDLGSWL